MPLCALLCAAAPVQAQEHSRLQEPAAREMPASASSPEARDWREAFTPFEDPLRTRPPELDQPLRLELPPDLRSGEAVTDRIDADNVEAFPCAESNLTAALAAFKPAHAAPTGKADGKANREANREAAGQPTPSASLPQSDQPQLSLSQAVRLALCRNAEVRGAWSAIAQQAAALGQARSAYLPQISAGANRYRSRLRYPGTAAPDSSLRVSSQNIGLSWLLFDFGAREARNEAANLQLQAALASRNAIIHNALREVAQTYFDAQIAWSRRQAQEELLPLAERTLQTTRRRQSRGASSGNDTLHAESALARIQLERSRAEGDYRKALSSLTQTLGLPAHTRYRLAPLIALPEPAAGKTGRQILQKALDDWLAEAAERHPAIRSAQAQWQAARANVRAVRAEGLPTISAGYNFYRNGRPNTALDTLQSRESVLSISLTLPLFDGFNTTYKVRGAQALAEQKKTEYEAARQQVLREIAQTHAETQAALDNLDAARRLFLTAQAAAQSTQRQYEGGAADILRLNQSLQDLQQALLERTRAEAEWLAARMKLWAIAAATEAVSAPTHAP